MNCVADIFMLYTVTVVVEFASARVDSGGGVKIDPLNFFMNISIGVKHFRRGGLASLTPPPANTALLFTRMCGCAHVRLQDEG